jgi:hypothetical protein
MLLAKGPEAAVADGDIDLIQYPKLKHAHDLYLASTIKHVELDKLDNYWIVGTTGTGKSSGARARWTDYYNKPLNKWWCSYTG